MPRGGGGGAPAELGKNAFFKKVILCGKGTGDPNFVRWKYKLTWRCSVVEHIV